jgi:tRNA modification GTPase
MNKPHDQPAHRPPATDTIAAIATAVGGAVAVVRLSGPEALRITTTIWHGTRKLGERPPRCLHLGQIRAEDGAILDHAMAVRFEAPASYTGEDMVELHCHGGGLVARSVLLRVLQAGARHADPGEFTRRAFLNGKMDLTQAEAVADLIAAHSAMALRLANRQLSGTLGRRGTEIFEKLQFILSETEVRLDFPEEDLDWTTPEKLDAEICEVRKSLDDLLASRLEGEVLREGVRLVLAGPPNVGKSSLMNAMLGRDRAIVTHIPGTTRDVLEEFAHIRGIPVRIIDTAGIREAEDIIERSGIERTLASMREAQVILWVFDAAKPETDIAMPDEFEQHPCIRVGNKIDLRENSGPLADDEPHTTVYTSASKGTGLDTLFDAIERVVWDRPHSQEPEIAISARHAVLIEDAAEAADDARNCVETEQWELAAVSLRTALDAVGRIIGRTVEPDVLDTIFARFCIGK